MSWQHQARDESGRFHTGAAPEKSTNSAGGEGMFGRDGLSQRIQAVAYGAVGALPQQLRGRASGRYSAGVLDLLAEAMSALAGGTRLSKAVFAERFFGRPTDDPVVEKLHDAALKVASARSHAELGDASRNVADAMKAIGLDAWPRFLANVQARAHEPETIAAVGTVSLPPGQADDAVRPGSPVEAAAGVAGGSAGAGRATNTTGSGAG